MKTPFKSVFAALVALFLSISLSGCFDEGNKTASKGGSNSPSIFADSGKVKLVLKPGASLIMMKFSEKNIAEMKSVVIRDMLQKTGIAVEEISFSPDSPGTVSFVIKMNQKNETVLALDIESLEFFIVRAYFGEELARWDPSYGDEARYIG